MKFLAILCFLLASCHQNNLATKLAIPAKAVFGTDDRIDLYQANDPRFITWARSSAGMINNDLLQKISNGESLQTLEDIGVSVSGFNLFKNEVCPETPFKDQPVAAACTGFLVAPDIIATAGHCMKESFYCENFSWAFDYKLDSSGQATIKNENIYHCVEILAQKLVYPKKIFDQAEYDYWLQITSPNNPSNIPEPKPIGIDYSQDNDYALIRLDRPVIGREPLKFRTTGKIELGTKLVIIGHPSGLPTKITTNGEVVVNDHNNLFYANIDAFTGNSGSPVFNAETGLIEGIHVQGGDPFEYDETRDCYYIKSYDNNVTDFKTLSGITRITAVPELMN